MVSELPAGCGPGGDKQPQRTEQDCRAGLVHPVLEITY